MLSLCESPPGVRGHLYLSSPKPCGYLVLLQSPSAERSLTKVPQSFWQAAPTTEGAAEEFSAVWAQEEGMDKHRRPQSRELRRRCQEPEDEPMDCGHQGSES